MGEAVDSSVIYPDRPDLHGRTMWRCPACKAYVGSHPGTDVPLGYPAGPETRALRSRVHKRFDPLWQAKMRRDNVRQGKARDAAYKWLAGELGIPLEATHVSHFDADRCRQALAIIEAVYSKAADPERPVRDTLV
jgi:hypothetical protein